ncbi:hypothetical protein SCLCIDRAFT_129409 [Scleroderma citrinum Foug A]|uniref:Uncharacterized protein n=1 Tax=Scleroderma citrinum Foug A TaxID=1036808 RepID=A0A0C3DB22_9AGAM|nr:hypothetical protein SCLCIDRAFT_129409 [Scleroderma citrinum Foug A]
MVSSPSNTAFSVLSFIGVILTSISLPWHLQSWNTGVCMYMIWTGFGCLILFINSIVWKDNVTNWAPVWCDIASRYLIGGSVGIPASSLCITRRLYYITKLQSLSQESKEKWREICTDISIGIGFPCVVMILQYVVQGHRFNIVEEVGCWPATVNTVASYFLVFMWPAVIGMITMVYSVLTFRQASIHRRKLKAMLQSSPDITTGHYCRLMAACTVEIAFTTPLGVYSIVINATYQMVPYISWENIHEDFSYVDQIPTVVLQSSPSTVLALESSRWSYVLCAFVLFVFFGWGRDAREAYGRTFQTLFRHVGLRSIRSASRNITARSVSSCVHQVSSD